jgi:hypothetical protein
VLVVWKLDRLSRSLRDVLTIMERLAEAQAGRPDHGCCRSPTFGGFDPTRGSKSEHMHRFLYSSIALSIRQVFLC